jgi:hypothetical protein
MLHVNNGDGTFSEMGRLANVEATDWSWGALLFDMDNDGKRDIFVANGIYQDITDLDYLNFIDDEQTKRKIISEEGVNFKALIDPIPVRPVSNYAFRNLGNLQFENVADIWGLSTPIHSNGSAYGDLNNDGTLDLVINNVNQPAQIFKNQGKTLQPENHSIQFQLVGKGKNTGAIGTQIQVKAGDQLFYAEQMPNRGFQSSVDPKITIGLGTLTTVDEVRVLWPDGSYTELKNQPVNQLLSLKWEEGQALPAGISFFPAPASPQFVKAPNSDLDFKHEENEYVDFDRDRLTYHMFSTEGPAFAKADVNGDGLEDLFFGGAKSFPGKIYLAQANGSFVEKPQADLVADALSEDTDAVFFDADGDGDLDLFVTSGGNESGFGNLDLTDRLYLNDGKGNFSKGFHTGMMGVLGSSSVVEVFDFNGDGAPDLFVGGRLVPFTYGAPADSQLWINDGKGNFTEQSATFAPELKSLGMVTDAKVLDYDGDGKQDLAVVGDWMAPTFFKNTGQKLEITPIAGMDQLKGWYRTLAVGDFNGDGKPDLALGNQGLNTRMKGSTTHPVKMFLNDFDQNGAIEQIYTRQIGEVQVPYTLKHELEKQVPSIKKKYIRYADYNNQSLSDIFAKEVIDRSIVQEMNHLQSGVLINQGNGNFEWKAFPVEAQKTWIFAIQSVDLNADGIEDLILGGNLSHVKPEVGTYDAGYGEILLGKGDGTFTFWPNRMHGLKLEGDIREFSTLGKNRLLVVKNSAPAEIWTY